MKQKKDNRPNPKAQWYDGAGRLLAQHLFGCVFPLANLETGWPEVYGDLLQVSKYLNRNLSQVRIETLIDIIHTGIQKRNKEWVRKHPKEAKTK